MASPSRSGSVARYILSAFPAALAIASTCFLFFSTSAYFIWKLSAGSTAPSLASKSRTWPYEATISKPRPRYFLRVFALEGDSTISKFWDMRRPAEKGGRNDKNLVAPEQAPRLKDLYLLRYFSIALLSGNYRSLVRE